ncbi:MAG: helix-turn-helix domain-containing protein [Acidimicrobiales bacterium]|nr:helix-turn-helix domain-containing protein [Acidimicrobiales bacterium]
MSDYDGDVPHSSTSDSSLHVRATRHAALGDPSRLAIVDSLAISDRSPAELGRSLQLPSNLLSHHLDVLERVGLVERTPSSGDRRRRYVRLLLQVPYLPDVVRTPARPALFVCTHNSARSQLAAALWRSVTGEHALSAGTDPSDRVAPGAIRAARRAGLDLGDARPRPLHEVVDPPSLVVTVCDRAHEALGPVPSHLHWSVPDPVVANTPETFDRVVVELRGRIERCFAPSAGGTAHRSPPPPEGRHDP